MKKNNRTSDTSLRQKALDLLETKLTKWELPHSESEMLKFIHELSVHQIELELQNEELSIALSDKLDTDQTNFHLSDSTLTGFIALSALGFILEINLVGASTLGNIQPYFIGKDFRSFISEKSKLVFNEFFKRQFVNKAKESCEIRFSIPGIPLLEVYITGIVTYNSDQCYISIIDITELKQAEEKLRISEERWKYALEGSTSGMWDWNISTGYVFYSSHWKAMLGYAESEVGDTLDEWKTRVHIEDRARTMATINQHINGECEIYTSEHRIVCKDGSYKWVLAEGKVVEWDNDGNATRVIGTHKDITSSKKTEFDLKERMKELNIHNSISELMSSSSFSTNEVIGKIVEIIPGGWQFSENTEARIQIYDTTYKTTGFKATEHSLKCVIKTGDKAIGEVEVCYIGHIAGEANDIFLPEEKDLLFSIAERLGNFIARSEKDFSLIESERKYRNLVENITDVIYEIDNTGIITNISSTIERIIGYSAEELIGKNFAQFVGINNEFLSKRLQELSLKNELENEYKISTKSGGSCWVRLSTNATLKDGKLLSAFGILIDITEKKLVELELQKSESLYRSILQASPDTIFISDLLGNVIFTSPMALKMFGYELTGFPVNIPLFDFLDPKDHSKAKNAISLMFAGTYTGATEYKGVKADGSFFDIEVNGEFIKDDVGKPISMVFIVRDISDRKIAEEKLRKSEEQYRKLIESINDVVFDVDLQGTIKFVSPSIENLFSLKPENLVGKNFFSFIHPDDLAFLVDIFKNNRFDEHKSIEYRGIKQTGEIIWVQVSAQNSYEDGKMVGRTGILHDITEQKQAEEKLRSSEEKYRTIFESMQDVFYEISTEGTILEISPSIEMFSKGQFTRSELIGKSILSFYSDQKQRDLFLSELFKHGKVTDYEINILNKDGSLIPVAVSSSFLYENSIPVRITGIMRDITERKQAENALLESEKRYRSLANSGQALIWTAGLDKKCTYFNQVWLDFTGRTMDQEYGDGWAEGVHPDDLERCFEIYSSSFDKREPFGMVYRLRRHDGEYRYLQDNGTPQYNSHGEFIGYIGHCLDISELKLAEDALRRSEEKYRNIFINAQEGVFQTNIDGTYISVNPALAKMYGFDTPEELMNGRLDIAQDAYNDPLERDNFISLMEEKGFIKGYEYEVKRKDGQKIWFYEDAKAIKDEQGKIMFFEGFVVDITERKQAEVALNTKTNLLTNLIVNLQEGILLEDSDRKIALTNQLFCTMFGIPAPPEALIGADCTGSAEQSKVFFKNPVKFIADIEKILTEKEAVYNDELELADGRYFERDYIPTYLENKYSGHLWKYRDISERKHAALKLENSEERFRQVVEQSREVVWEVDSKGLYTYVSPLSMQVYGYSAEQLVGKMHFYDIAPEEGREEFKNAALSVFDKKITFENLINSVCRPDGKIITVETNGIPMLNADGLLIGYRGIDADITSRVKAEKTIRESEEKFRSITEQTSDLIAITDENGCITFASPSSFSVFLISSADMCGRNFWDFIDENEIERSLVVFQTCMESDGKIKDVEFRMKRADGTLFIGEINGSKFITETQSGILVTIRNITERKQTELIQNARIRLSEFAPSHSRNELQQKLLDELEQLTGSSVGFFHAVNADQKTLVLQSWSANTLNNMCNADPKSLHYNIDKAGVWAECVTLRKAVIHNDYLSVENRRGIPEGHAMIIRELLVPIFRNGLIVAIVGIGNKLTDYVEKDIEFVSKLSDLAWDITERKGAEESVKKLSQALIQSPVMTYITDISGLIEYANPKVVEVTGYTESELLGQNPRIFSSGEKSKEEYQILWETISAGNEWKGEFHNKMKNGDLYWVSASISPVTDSTGNITHFLAVEENITHRKLAEENIQYQNERLNAIVTALPDLIFVIDARGNYNEFYQSNNNLRPIAPEAVVGTNLKAFFNKTQACDYLKKIRECIAFRKLLTFEYQVSDGNSLRNFEARLTPFGNDKILSFVRDVTEQKEKEIQIKKLSLAVEQSPVSIVITDLKGNIEYINKAFEKATGYSFDEVKGRNPRILKSGKMDDAVYKNLWETISAGKEWYGEWINKRKNGKFYWEDVSVTPIFGDEGNITNYLAVKQDISQRKQTEKDIRDLNANLEYKIEIRTAQLAKTNETLLNEIEERNKAAVALEEALDRLRKIADRVPGFVYQFRLRPDGSSCFPFASEGIYDVCGVRPGAVSGDAIVLFDIIHPEDLEALYSSILKSAKELSLWMHEYRIIIEDGSVRWLFGNALPQTEADGSILWHGFISDITERKKAEEELKQVSTRLALAALAGGVGVWDLDIVNNILVWDKQMFELYGMDEKDFSGAYDAWLQGVHPDDVVRGNEEIQMAIQNEKEFDTEFRVVWPDTSIHIIRAMGIVQRDSSGTPLHLVGTNWDITAQKHAEDALRESEAKHSSMISNISDVIGILGDDGLIKYKSPNIAKDFGWQPEDLIGTSGWLTVHPDDLDRIQKEFFALLQKDNNVKTVEYKYLCKDGTYKPIELTATNLVNDKVINGVLLNYHDTTLRKLAEESLRESETRFSLFMDHLPALVFIKDGESKMIFANNAIDAALGASKWIGKPLIEFFDAETAARIIEDDKKTLESGYQKIEESFPTLDGILHHYETQKFIIPVENQNPLLGGIAIDITDRKFAEDEIKKAKIEAEKANLAKSEFLSRMSHELRTPMNSILGFAQLMEMGELNPAHRKGVNHILKSGKHLLGLINEVLDISRIEAGHISISLEHVKVFGLINEMIDTLRLLADAREVQLIFTAPAQGQLYVNSDLQRLKQVMLNLLSNAIKYNRVGGSVTVTTEIMQMNSAGIAPLHISITDTGIGIPSEKLALLFIPFERIGAEKTETEGTGLGLTVVKKLIEAMGGNIGVKSVVGEGSTFWIELPTTDGPGISKKQSAKNALLTEDLRIANKELSFHKLEKAERAAELVIANTELVFQNQEKAKRAAELEIANTKLAFQNEEKEIRAEELAIARKELAFWNEGLLNANVTKSEKKGTILYIDDNASNIELVEQIILSYRPNIRIIGNPTGSETVQLAIANSPDMILLDLDLPDIHGSIVMMNLQENKDTMHIPVIIISADAMQYQIKKLLKAGARKYLTKPLNLLEYLNVIDEFIDN